MARSKKACLIFFDEVDAIGGARFDDGAGALLPSTAAKHKHVILIVPDMPAVSFTAVYLTRLLCDKEWRTFNPSCLHVRRSVT